MRWDALRATSDTSATRNVRHVGVADVIGSLVSVNALQDSSAPTASSIVRPGVLVLTALTGVSVCKVRPNCVILPAGHVSARGDTKAGGVTTFVSLEPGETSASTSAPAIRV